MNMPPPPPPTLYQGNFGRPRSGWGAFRANFDYKPWLGFFVAILLVVGGFWYTGGMDKYVFAEATPTPSTETAPTPDLMATLQVMQAAAPSIVTQTIIMSNTGSISDAAAIATAAVLQYQASQPAINGPGTKLLVGSIRIDDKFGYCARTNIGFIASGAPYFLSVDIAKLPTQDLFNSQIQVLAVQEAVANCQFPLLKVIDIRFSGQATPAPLNPAMGGRLITEPVYMTETGEYSGAFPSVAPTTNNPYLADIPFNGPDGKPLPTATPQPTATMSKTMVNLIGTIIQAEGCADSNFSLTTSSGEFLVQFATLPTVSPMGYEVMASGELSNLCGRRAIKISNISYIPTATPVPTNPPKPTRMPDPTDTPTPTPTPVKVMLAGEMVELGGCDQAPYGLKVGEKSYYLLFDNLNIPPKNTSILVRGLLSFEVSCPYTMLRVIDFALPTPTPTGQYTPTTTPTATPDSVPLFDEVGIDSHE